MIGDDAVPASSTAVASPDAVPAIRVLETKLYIPKWPAGLVSRARLIERIGAGAEHKLTLVSAPAGFGKTTLLSEWLAQRPASARPAGWVSLDASDNEARSFWAHVLRALQKIELGVGEHAYSLLQSADAPSPAVFLTPLINDLLAIDDDIVLILDDYHVVESPAVHAGLTFLIDHLPPRMHVIVASRSEPPLPIARLRARGVVTELRPADLRFTASEASAFLNQVMALELSAADVATLEQRTEGWIAGLKLAALSLQGRGDVHHAIDAFSGDNRFIADYLIEEVLNGQPERIQRFLLGTALLDRLSGPLCDAVTGEHGSQAVLESLERSNLFVVALDDTREWFRYHHLFADVLQSYSRKVQPDRFRFLHRRASSWYEEHGSTSDAVRHALAAEDVERAARLLEMAWPAMDRSYRSCRWLTRVKELPDALVRTRPVLSMGYAWALLNAGELEAAETRLDDVARWIDPAAERDERRPAFPGEMIVLDEDRFRTLPVQLASARVYLAQARGDLQGTVEHARRALELTAEDDHAARATGAALLALAQWATGELEAAHGTFASAIASMRAAGEKLSAIRGTFVLGDIRVVQGRLHEAAAIYEHGLQLATEATLPAAPETDELHLGLSELHRERDELDAAARRLQMTARAVDRAGDGVRDREHAGNRERWCTAMARVAEARGDLAGALHLLEEAERLNIRTPLPRVRPIAAMKARIRLAQGRLADADGWVRERALSADDELSYLREYEHITLARVLLARYAADGDDGSIREALLLLERLATAAIDGRRAGSLIEILVLQAIAHQLLRSIASALAPLERALALGEAGGYVRVFVDEGDRMRELLRHAAARGIAGEYTRRLLAAFEPAQTAAAPAPPAGADRGAAATTIAAARVAELLTARELEILRLIAAGLRNLEIADQLFISPATVKRHIANAYLKLGAGHRTEALARAHALKLL